MEFSLKPIRFFGRECPIICQNENGPCPLLAIANVLLLQNKISISTDRSLISLSELTQIVANAILEKIGSSTLPDHIKLVESVLNILPKLAHGLDLNVIFSGVKKFEFTEEISVFDALDIQLLHGWIYDANDRVTASVIGNQSYNHLIFRLVEYKSLSTKNTDGSQESQKSDASAEETEQAKDLKLLQYEGFIMEAFLNKTAQQFTYTGMLALYNTLQDRQFAVFFRNNHFSTLFFYNGQLFSLITDQGYRDEANVVWEILNDVDGNSEFYDSGFEQQSFTPRADYLQQFGVSVPGTIASPARSTAGTSAYGGTVAAPPTNLVKQAPTQEPAAVKAETPTEASAPADGDADVATCAEESAPVAAVDVDNDATGGAGQAADDDQSSAAEAAPAEEPAADEHHYGENGFEEAYELVDRDIPCDTDGAEGIDSIDVTVEIDVLANEGAGDDAADGAVDGVIEVTVEDAADEVLPMEAAPEQEPQGPTMYATVTEPMRLCFLEASVSDSGASAYNALVPSAAMETLTVDNMDTDMMFAMQLQAQEELLAQQDRFASLDDDDHQAYTAYSAAPDAVHRPAVYPHEDRRTQEEIDREFALQLHNEEVRADEQYLSHVASVQANAIARGRAQTAPPERSYTTMAGSTSSAFPYNRSEERSARPARGAKKEGCVMS